MNLSTISWKAPVLFFLWICLSLFWANSFSLAFYRLLMLAQALVIAFFIKMLLQPGARNSSWNFWRPGNNLFLWLLISFAVFESLLGFTQVVLRGSAGFYKLGEPHLNLLDPTISKTIVSGGGRLLRAYGTFPHPNILAAFLLIGLIALIHLMATKYENNTNMRKIKLINFRNFANISCFAAFSFVLLLGLILTFSRAAWLVGTTLFLFFVLRVFVLREVTKPSSIKDSLVTIIISIFCAVFCLVSIFSWAIFLKLNFSIQEPAINLRLTYLKIGWEIFKQRPLLGVGLGNEVFYARRTGLFEKFALRQELQQQPIHNIYLLILSESGLVGLGLFLWFIFLTLKDVLKRIMLFGKLKIESVVWLVLLALGLFDHFLWTIPAGQVMFWSAALLLINEI